MKILIRTSLLFFIASTLFATSLKSQSLELISKDTLVQGTKDDYLTGHAILKNISNGVLNVKMNLLVIEKTDGHALSYCYLSCYAFNSNNYTTDVFTLKKDSTTGNSLSFDCLANGHPGITKLQITCFNSDNPQDNVSYDLTFDATLSSVSDYFSFDDNSFTLYPNPASNFINFNYTLQYKNVSSKIEIYNSNGSLIQTVNNNNTLDLNSFSSGVYYSRLLLDGKPQTTKKFVINH